MICEVDEKGKVAKDPHRVRDNQGNTQAAGGVFNKWWQNWNDINAMAQVCEDYLKDGLGVHPGVRVFASLFFSRE